MAKSGHEVKQPAPQQQLNGPPKDQEEEVDDDEDDDEDSDEGDDEDPQKFVETSPNGRFERFDEELGRGAYKTVYRGLDLDTGREVAWSIISLGRLPKSERPRIKSEIKLIKELHHRNIITFISAWICKEKEQIHFITEMITGGSLRQYLKKMGNPKLKVIKHWCHEILEGLNYLHTQATPIIHRDIKCDNIFINSNSGEIKIGDLGLSTTMKNSYTSSVLGTPEFMAPELYEEYYGTEVDIYAFGMALLEMLTREAPYRECQNPAQIYRKVVNRDYPQSLSRIKDEQVREFIMWCLDDRSRRPTAGQLLDSEFMNDMTSENNGKPCEVHEHVKIKVFRKKLFTKNQLAEIPEEEAREDQLQSSVQTSGKVQQKQSETPQLPKQPPKDSSAEVIPSQVPATPKKEVDQNEKSLENQIGVSDQSPAQIQKSEQDTPSPETQPKLAPDEPGQPEPAQSVETSPKEEAKDPQTPNATEGNPPIQDMEVKTESRQAPEHVHGEEDEQAHEVSVEVSEDDENQRKKLDETIHYLNTLDAEKTNRLNDESGFPKARDTEAKASNGSLQVEEQKEAKVEDLSNLLQTLKNEINQNQDHDQEGLFVDGHQLNIERDEKNNSHDPPLTHQIKSQEGLDLKSSAPVTLMDAKLLESQRQGQQYKQQKNILQQLQEDLAKEEHDKELRRQKEILKQSIQSIHKSSFKRAQEPTSKPDHGQKVPSQEIPSEKAKHTEAKKSPGQDQGTQSDTHHHSKAPKQTSSSQPQNQDSIGYHPTHKNSTPIAVNEQLLTGKQQNEKKWLKKEDLDKEIKKFKEDDLDSGTPLDLMAIVGLKKKQPTRSPEKRRKESSTFQAPLTNQPALSNSQVSTSTQAASNPQAQTSTTFKTHNETRDSHSGNVLDWNIVGGDNKNRHKGASFPSEKALDEVMVATSVPAKHEPSQTTPVASEQQTTQLPKRAQKASVGEKNSEHSKEEKIQMQIQILDNEVTFDFWLNKDTPEDVAHEFVTETKLDSKYYVTVRDGIKNLLDKYKAKNKNKRGDKAASGTQKQVPAKKNPKTEPLERVSKFVSSENKQVQIKEPSDKHKQLREYEKERNQYIATAKANFNKAKTQEAKLDPPPPALDDKAHLAEKPQTEKNQLKKKAEPQKQGLLTQAAQVLQQKPQFQEPGRNSEEFIKRRDEFKSKYKNMNNSIRTFFQSMAKEQLDIDQVLDTMDYTDGGDRAYKKDFIGRLQKIFTKFLHQHEPPSATPQAKDPSRTGNHQVGAKADSKQSSQTSHQNSHSMAVKHSDDLGPRGSKEEHHAGHEPAKTQLQQPSKKHSSDQNALVKKKQEQVRARTFCTYKRETHSTAHDELKQVQEIQVCINNIKVAVAQDLMLTSQGAQGQREPPQQEQPLSSIKVDGIFGKSTETEVKKIQERMNIDQDGVVTAGVFSKMEGLLTQINFKNQLKLDLIKQTKHKEIAQPKPPAPKLPEALPPSEPDQEKLALLQSKAPATTQAPTEQEKKGASAVSSGGQEVLSFGKEGMSLDAKQITQIAEVDPNLEEQESSGTNPSRGVNEGGAEEGYEADQTFLTMNSKDKEEEKQDRPQEPSSPAPR